MARKNAQIDLTTRTGRSRLRVQPTLYWKALKPGQLHLGYDKRKPEGKWVVRIYLGVDTGGMGRYQKQNLAFADDLTPADGEEVLSFVQAQELALARHAQRQKAGTAHRRVGPLTVADVMDAYLRHLRAHGQPAEDAERRIRVHILPSLGNMKVEDLTTSRLTAWRDARVAEPARLRTAKGKPQRFRKAPVTADQKRARRATCNRTVSVLKAALNRAFKAGRVHDDLSWRRLEPFPKVGARRQGFLSIEQSQRLLNSADAASGFRDLCTGALLTGARYSELCRMVVGDYQRGRLAVHVSKSGRARDIRLSQEGRDFFAALTAGRPADEPLFRRADQGPWQKSQAARWLAAACKAARVTPAISFHSLRHSHASLAIMNGTPLMVVAENLGHRDSRMCERHYAHLTQSYSDQAIEAGAPVFGVVQPSNLVQMKKESK